VRKYRRRNKNRTVFIVGLMVAPVVAIGGAAAMLATTINAPRIDKKTFCYPGVETEAAALVDLSFTRANSGSQDRDLKTALQRAFAALPPNGRLSVFSTERTAVGSLSKPMFTICRPPSSPDELNDLAGITKPAPYLRRLVDRAEKGLDARIEELAEASKDENRVALDSPILEQIQAISRFSFEGDLKSFVVFSDGINNSEIARFCVVRGALPPFMIWRGTNAAAQVKPNSFAGVSIEFLLVEQYVLPHPEAPFCSNDELRAFWPAFFEGNGATAVTLTRVRAAAGS
jgi:hypothetical protein